MTTKYRRKARLTLPIFSLVHTPVLQIEVTGAMHGEVMPGLTGSEDREVIVMPVLKLDTGEEGMLIVPAMVQSALKKTGVDYVGKKYELVAGEKSPDKNYRPVDVYELEA